MRRSLIFTVVVTLLLTMVAGLAYAKEKPAGKKDKKVGKGSPKVTYVFRGEVVSVGEDPGSVKVDVKKVNNFARSYANQQVDFPVNEGTEVVINDAEAAPSDLDAGDRVVVQLSAPKSGVSDLTARKIVAESPIAYYFDADGDGIGAAEPGYYFAGEEPDGYVGVGGDNCVDVANPEQTDSDNDQTGDACDDVVADDTAGPEETV